MRICLLFLRETVCFASRRAMSQRYAAREGRLRNDPIAALSITQVRAMLIGGKILRRPLPTLRANIAM